MRRKICVCFPWIVSHIHATTVGANWIAVPVNSPSGGVSPGHPRLRVFRGGLGSCVARCSFLAALAWPGWGIASGAEARWGERTSPVFQLVASQSTRDASVPYTGAPGVLAQDGQGFLWIGTESGLERWDGYRMRTFAAQPGNACALQSDNIWALYADEQKRLWVGTLGGGVARYDPQTDCLQAVGAGQESVSSATVEALAGDGGGGAWVGTATGLLHVSADLTQVTRVSADASDEGRLTHGRIVRLLRDRTGALWVGTDEGLQRLGRSETRFSAVPLPSSAAGSVKVRALFESSDGRIWVGTLANGAYVIDPSTMHGRPVEDILARNEGHGIWAVAETPAGEVWLATHDSGILVVDPKSLHSRVVRHRKGVPTSLPGDSVFDLLRDRSGLLWAASDSGWLGYFQTQAGISTILTADEAQGVPEGAVAAAARTNDDRIAIAVGNKIAIIGPRGTGAEPLPIDLPLPSDKVTSLAVLNGRDLFAGVNPIGLVWFDRTARRSRSVSLPGPGQLRHVTSLLADGDRLWVGALEGIWAVEPRRERLPSAIPWEVTQQSDLRNVLVIAVGRGGTRWFGTTNGLFRSIGGGSMPKHVELRIPSGGPLPDMFVTSLHIDRRGRLWMGTNTQGLFVLDTAARPSDGAQVLRQVSSELPNSSVDQILEDESGGIWVSTDRGLARVDADTFSVRRFGRGDGAAISAYWIGSGIALEGGELMFGGQDGITLVRPAQLAPNRYPPPIVITRISVGHREVPSAGYNRSTPDQVLEIPADAQSVAVEYAALDYADPERISYAYRLDGYDRTWVRTGSDMRVAMYTNLAPGTYHLHVRGTDHAGTWSASERQITVRMAAAWYQSMWFQALELLAALSMLVLVVQARTVLLRARQRELELLVDGRTRALVQMTEARNSLIENLAHDLRTPLTSLRGYLDRLNLDDEALTDADRSRFVGIALRQVERLIRLVGELFELVRLDDPLARLTLERFSPAEVVQDVVQEFGSIAEGRSIGCELAAGVESVQIQGDISLFQRLIDNLVDNAVGHTPPGGKVAVKLGFDEASIIIEVSDTGRGIERTDLERIFNRYERGDAPGRLSGAGLGLAIVKRILELHHGSIVVDSEVGSGARFLVRLPRSGPAAASSST